ncbi:cholesterol transporter ABCA5-like [Euwallacea fornicatus]|uniref:cholesterol transporter ABCA5-like n=1 Tax=Euwallacea fornicatus TaxID=995702 RepID=UPI00338F91D2
MGDQRRRLIYFAQLRAMLKRNLLLKKRDKRATLSEVLLPIYTLSVLFFVKAAVPNPNFPEINQPRGAAELMANFRNGSHTVAVVPNSTEVQDFLRIIDVLRDNMNENQYHKVPPIAWVVYPTIEDLLTAYWMEPNDIPLAVIFQSSDPINGPLRYEIRTNPNLFGTPSTTQLFGSPVSCREHNAFWHHVPGVPTPVLPEGLEVGDSCPVNQYYHSGFLALQALIDFSKIRLDAGMENLVVPKILLELFPKASYTGNWIFVVRVIIPLYIVVALSQFITYLLILIVGEKEKKIKEGMKIMGLYDSVFWLSWFIVYAVFVLLITIICCTLLFALNIFTTTSFIMVFLLVFMYCLSIIMFGFMLTPFFDKSRTAGILGNFAVTILSLLYFIQVFVRDSSSVALWVVSLISPAGFALAMDKALLMDLAGEGVNLSNIWNGPDMPFGGSLIMMAVDVVLYGWIAFYLDSVVPSEYGVKRSPFFCFNPLFWCKAKSADKIPLSNGESVGSVGSLTPGDEGLSSDVEPVPRELKGKEAIKIVDLFKSFKSFRKKEVQAVNGINLSIYQGHITAILGHNGAGKTTLFNILTGLTAPTSGTAYIFGYDVRNQNDMDQVRRMTGVCPQHDILFDNLSPREHLEFFATVKGISSKNIDHEVTRTLQDIDLVDKANTRAIHLSGGQKRKLSVGIAIIGDPKIIILDEPTAGVDPYSRRHMWNLLQNRRHGKVILLTTHFMDEADILADRKAVVSKGSIRCCGSSLFLKNKFGIGYHLTLVLEGNSKEHAIARLVTSHVVKAEKARRHGRELSFILPHNDADHFASLFSAIEQEINNKSSKLGISSYGVSMTTLEEVFLHLEKGEDELDDTVDNLSTKIVRNRALSRSLSLQSKSTSYQSLQNQGNNLMANGQDVKGGGETMDIGGLEVISETKSPISGIGLEKIECTPNNLQTILALIKLRCLRMMRDIQKLYFMILLPLVCAAVTLYFNKYFDTNYNVSRSLELNGTSYGEMSTVAIHNGSRDSIREFVDQLIFLGARQVDFYDGNFSTLLAFAPHIAAFDVHKFQDGDYSFTILYNDTFQHSLPVTLNLLSNSIYRILTAGTQTESFEPIRVMAQPFQQTIQAGGFNIASTTQTIFVGMVFVLVPVSLAIDMVHDREMRTKNQLRVNGLTTTMYFLTYFIVLMAIMGITCSLLMVIMVVFDIPALRDWPAIVVFSLLIFIYCPSSILSCTCISYIFDKTESALSILPNVATMVGWLPFIFVVLSDVMNIGKRVTLILHCTFSITNTMYIPYAIFYYIQKVYMLCNVNLACDRLTLASYFTFEIGICLFGMLINIPLWFLLLRVVDIMKNGGNVSDAFKFRKGSNEEVLSPCEEAEVGINGDDDVKAEREKVKNLINSHNVTHPVVMVHDLYKEYKNQDFKSNSIYFKPDKTREKIKVPVKSLSLAVDAGEVFGLLGHNGAGKTTTMKIITAEEAPTRGRVFIGGQSITSNLSSAFQLLGYCPQHDALWRNITVREHLETYAAIRGVPHKDINKIINRYINGLQINDHADKQVKMCSGGTKRKLSFAMAMLGNPKIVLLDEPSTGMDPRSKRFLWDTILASFQGSKGAILTTHSMEEADALCSRVGITVRGELRCLGSTQHLKNLYGAGYTLEMKLLVRETTPTSDTGDRHQELKDFVSELFPDASLEESFADRLVFSVPQQSVPSLANCFMQLEKAKVELDIEEYSFSQTTLEQVFLKFAQYDEVNEECK